ncbi:MAG: hypothetical protein E6G42_00110 [Actinobacteria bacterium]|nr:MAG: hypothetical protein E6G42_00110 [Actinomycetota bacterium]
MNGIGAGAEGAREEPVDWVKWFSWRGSPQLVAQVARAATRAVEGVTVSTIDVCVGEDHEVFADPYDFTRDATPEALRDFSSIRIHVSGAVILEITFYRDVAKRVTIAFDSDSVPDEGVLLEIFDRDDAVAPSARAEIVQAVFAAINRGATSFAPSPVGRSPSLEDPPKRGNTKADKIVFVLAAITVSAGLAVAAILVDTLTGSGLQHAFDFARNSLPHWARDAPTNFVISVLGVAIILAAGLSSRWVRPPVEVAAPGQTRLIRVARYAAGLLVTLAIAALSKKVLKL